MMMSILGALLAAALLPVRTAVRPQPADETTFTSTRYITGIAVAPDGRVWASTQGGVLTRAPGGGWWKTTTADGLPSNEVSGIRLENGTPIAVTPVGTAAWREGKWVQDAVSRPAPLRYTPEQLCAVEWKGQTWAVSAWEFLAPRRESFWSSFYESDMHLNNWSHVGALLPVGDWLWVGLYGEGILAYDGRGKWTRPIGKLPDGALEITALDGDARHLWVGTRREGLWEYDGEDWTQHLQPDEPYDHNCQALAVFNDRLVVSTQEDGLLMKGEAWTRLQEPVISTNAPRQLAVCQGCLYVRHAGGQVDVYDGETWRRDICHALPRKEVTALASDGRRLYAAQWGGWSEFDGTAWTHHLKEKDLQGVPVLALYPDGDVLWVGTQKRGLGGFHHATGAWEWHDERRGLPDDWVRAVLHTGDSLYAGTFVGGLVVRRDGNWAAVPGLAAGEITALEPSGPIAFYAGTRAGVWALNTAGGAAPRTFDLLPSGLEVQALCHTVEGLWIGARTGIFFVPNPPEL